MKIHGLIKTTLLDYPKHLAAAIFLNGCNFRCPFCHNASLVIDSANQPVIDEDEVLSLLKKRHKILEGVCITGGEPTIHPELPDFIKKIKDLGLHVKLDTNGQNPYMLKELLNQKLLDYIAMDIKNSKNKYGATIGRKHFDLQNICESVLLLMSCGIDYEFRTTIVKEFHTEEDILNIGNWIQGAKAFYLQSYKDSGDILSPGLSNCEKQVLEEYKKLLTPYVDAVYLRGID